MKRNLRIAGIALVAFAVFCFVNNTNLLSDAPAGRPQWLAHRGLAQTYDLTGVGNDTCTASRILPPEHPYLENTIASMRAAFAAGADIVEFDVHPTTDGAFAVFHDWTLDCRTDGHGVTRAQPLATLRSLDIGYGYTADGGRTFPFRHQGVGLMPTLDEVLAAFPGRRFLINVKSDDPAEGELLAERLARLAPEQRRRLMSYGGERPMAVLRERLPEMRVMSRRSLTRCGLGYLALGWSGHVPAACRRSLILVPVNLAPWLWGWPGRLLARMRRNDTLVFVTGPYGKGDPGTRGVDDRATLARLPPRFSGGIWTNRIDRVGPRAE
jgi:glycerophosphoryl diester phosphodiesterase